MLAEGISPPYASLPSFVCMVSVILCAALQALGRPIPAWWFPCCASLCSFSRWPLLLGALRPSLVAGLPVRGRLPSLALLLYRRTARGRLAGMEE